MKVKLLKDVMEGETFDAQGKKINEGTLKTIKKAAQYAPGPDGQPALVRSESVLQFRKNAEIEMSDASALKYIEAGLAVSA